MRPAIGTKVVAVVIAIFFLAPTLVIVGSSFTAGQLVSFPPRGFSLRWYAEILSDPAWISAFVNSLETGLLAALLAVVAGTLLALGVARGRGIPRGLVTALAATPMLVPLVVIGLGAYVVYVRFGLVGNVLGLAAIHAALGVPYVFVNVLTGLTTMDRRLEDAARVSGANEIRTFFRVTLPLIAGSALTGALLAFVTSWDEVVVAIFMTTPEFHTLPIEIYGQLRSGVQPSTSAVATLVTLVSLLILIAVSVAGPLQRRRQRATRRSNA